MTSSRFALGATDFLLDGAPHRILSGALHYFRVHPDHWADRIEKARLLGLNTIETYVPWNDHEPVPGAWTADGALDLARFLDLVQAAGMHAIVRPGPYICAEYDNGGLPAWLFTDPEVGIRRFEPRFMAAVESYLRRVYDIVAPRQIDAGGAVILVQIENEYGAYGSDRQYLRALVDITRDAGITVPLTTVDQPEPEMLENGSLPDLLKTGSFGSRSPERLATLRAHQPTGPLMSSEYWNGWFDFWGGEHHVTSAEAQARDLDALLATGASVNLYMFHGGTNFGFTNGANDKGVYEPTVTSYDYDAPLDEAGNPTPKYFAFREVLAKYTDVPSGRLDRGESDLPTPAVRSIGAIGLLEALEHLGSWRGTGTTPATFDEIGHFRGLMALRTALPGNATTLRVGEVRDRATLFVDGVLVGVLDRASGDRAQELPAGRVLTVVVEDQGRVNYERRIGEPKGLIGPVELDGHDAEWEALALDVAHLGDLPVTADADPAAAGVHRFEFDLDEAADLQLDTSGLGKGAAFVNGFALGRYWSVGPQHTLYVPGPATRAGANELVILDLAGPEFLPSFAPRADLGPVVRDTLSVQGA
ncbi:beta-galactosidase [Frondihabitans sp. PhB188]|uniref:glycoside hydrolase family 35 protein n=1 Tax=Frondihabitans sp. PhB188 TaxID=2485200 RepID=UPI000F4AF08D|nr:beta-galactosidase family protein [Frondihabitans sp. PhB188]ROQ41599.1 beta-galactosidase [Frondihabitans sp. PhB188]